MKRALKQCLLFVALYVGVVFALGAWCCEWLVNWCEE